MPPDRTKHANQVDQYVLCHVEALLRPIAKTLEKGQLAVRIHADDGDEQAEEQWVPEQTRL